MQIAQGGSVVGLAHDRASRLTRTTLPNGVALEYGYDVASRLTGISYRFGTTELGSLTYVYDAAGQPTGRGGSWARTGLPQPVSSASYDAGNQQLALGSRTMTYDANGSLATLTDPTGVTTYTWDARNRLTGLTGPGLTASFGYDGINRRRTKTLGGSSTEFVYDGPTPVQERQGAIIVANLLTGLGLDEYFARTDATGLRALLTDALGSTLALTDAAGALTAEYTYEPFGVTTVSGVPSGNAFQFTGRENDGTGLYHYRARYYHPALQRFISQDPLGLEGGVNVFAYAANNPLRYIDPLGLKALICSRPLRVGGQDALVARHAYVVTDDTDKRRPTLSLFPENGQGVMRPDARDDRPTGLTVCQECRPRGTCSVKQCLENAAQAYPVGAYYPGGPNSNTFAATLARKCCANGFPGGLGPTPGANAVPPLPGTRATAPSPPGGPGDR